MARHAIPIHGVLLLNGVNFIGTFEFVTCFFTISSHSREGDLLSNRSDTLLRNIIEQGQKVDYSKHNNVKQKADINYFLMSPRNNSVYNLLVVYLLSPIFNTSSVLSN